MMFDLEQAVSIVIFGIALILITGTHRYAWSLSFNLLIAAIVTYLAFGWIFYDPTTAIVPASRYIQSYLNSIIIILAVAGYVASMPPGPRLLGFLTFLRNVFLTAAASVWASPILYQYYVNLPFSAGQRMGGFFANPNGAATASLLAVALTLALPFRSRLVQLAAVSMAGAAVCLTFSKSGISLLIAILTWHMLRSAKGLWRMLLPIGALIAIIVIQDPAGTLQTIAESSALDLSNTQKNRIAAVGRILELQIDEKTSTGRTFIWRVAIDRAWDNFPLGNGLGSGHQLVGGIFELGVWQGTHNTFLMVWYESGVLPVLLLVGAMGSAVILSVRYARGQIELTCLFLLVATMNTGHTFLAVRPQNIVLAVIFGLLARASRERAGHARLSKPIAIWPYTTAEQPGCRS